MSAVVNPLAVSQVAGAVRLLLPSNWDGPSGVVVEVNEHNTGGLLMVVLTAIRAAGDPEAIENARKICRLMLGDAS
jgi:hypothetical protein